MNERIKELSIQAGFPEWSNHAIEFELEQFAELIVTECAELFDRNEQSELGYRIGDRIYKHFGVE